MIQKCVLLGETRRSKDVVDRSSMIGIPVNDKALLTCLN